MNDSELSRWVNHEFREIWRTDADGLDLVWPACTCGWIGLDGGHTASDVAQDKWRAHRG